MIGKAMGNPIRLQILDDLVKGPRTLNELAANANLKPESILHHIRILQQVGLIEEFEPFRKGGPGRPFCRYKLSGKMVKIQYPQRNYAMLAEILLQQLQNNGDNNNNPDMKKKFRDIGVTIGKATAEDVSAKYGVKRWDLNSLRQFFIEDYLNQIGIQPEVITADETQIHYRQYNCLFLEIAKKYPDLICSIDEGLYDGLLTSMDVKADATKMKCMAHGSDWCEYKLRAKQTDLANK